MRVWSVLGLVLVLCSVIRVADADDTAKPTAAPEEDVARSVFDERWVASGMVASMWMHLTKDAGPDGPDRVKKQWYFTCVIDAWAAGMGPFDDVGDRVGPACFKWSQLPATAMQTRGDHTPYTAGTMNSMMLVTTYAMFIDAVRKMFPGGSEQQVHVATSCMTDLDRSQGDEAWQRALVPDGPCFRLAGLAAIHTKKGRKAKPSK